MHLLNGFGGCVLMSRNRLSVLLVVYECHFLTGVENGTYGTSGSVCCCYECSLFFARPQAPTRDADAQVAAPRQRLDALVRLLPHAAAAGRAGGTALAWNGEGRPPPWPH